MKDQLYAVVSKETGNTLCIFCNIDDAINVSVGYEYRTGKVYEIQEVSKAGAKEMIDKKWIHIDPNAVEILVYSKP